MPINCVYYTLQEPYQEIYHTYNLLCGHVPQLYAGFAESDIFLPREIFTVRAIDFNKNFKAQFGLYVDAYEDRVVTNTHHPRTFPWIY